MKIPAILGGKPEITKPFPKYNTIGKDEIYSVNQILKSGELSGFVAGNSSAFYGGKWVKKLESEFCKVYKVKHAIAVNSATSGLYSMVMSMNIEPGDEVITSPYTMHATASSILQAGGVPIFADIESDYYSLDPLSVENKINKRTKGILAVNIFGHAAKLDVLKKIAKKYNLWLCEDNSQAPSAVYMNRFTGTYGDASVFSFNRHKTMQSGEGGVVITNNSKIAKKIQLVRNHGEAVVSDFKVSDIVNTIGQNLRMTEMEAAVAYHQFKKLGKLNKQRILLANRLTKNLNSLKCIETPKISKNSTHVYYFYVMKYDEKKAGLKKSKFIKAINAEGYYMREGYIKPLYLEPIFKKKIVFGKKGFPFTSNINNKNLKYKKGDCPNCEYLNSQRVILTNLIYPPITTKQIDKFTDTIKNILDHSKLIESKI